ncbi:ABC transporter permease, partial [Escherichia coli]
PDIQVNVDATRMSQAFTGNGYIQNIINGEVNSFVARYRDNSEPLVSLETRMRFNPNLDPAWFGGVMAIINNITMLAIVLTGSALIREREHGTVEHLLVMPITPFEIMMAKVWSMGLVVLVVSGLSLVLMVKGVSLAQAILYRGAGFEIVWPQFLTLMAIGGAFFTIALLRFRKTIGTMA